MNNWLISPTVQIVDINGNPVVGGKVFVYDADTSNLSTIYSDESTPIANPVEIDELGNVTIWAELSKFYDIAVYDTGDNLLFAKKHICPGILSETNLDINAGDGCIVTKSGDTYTISVDFDTVATQAELVTKQDKLEAGRNIEITPTNVINVTGRRAIVTQAPLQSNMSDSAWVVSFDSDTFIDSNGLMETSKLEFDPTSSRYVSYNGVPLGESASTGSLDGYVPFSATALGIGIDNGVTGGWSLGLGSGNTANSSIALGLRNEVTGYGVGIGQINTAYGSVAIGRYNNAAIRSVALGLNASANTDSFAILQQASAYDSSIAMGYSARADKDSIAVGKKASAYYGAIALGENSTAANHSIAINGHAVGSHGIAIDGYAMDPMCIAVGFRSRAENSGIAVGTDLKAGSGTMVFGSFNYAPNSANGGWIFANGKWGTTADIWDEAWITPYGGISARWSMSGLDYVFATGGNTGINSGNSANLRSLYSTVKTYSSTWGGGSLFPIINDVYTADCDGSSFNISTTTSTMTLSESGAKYISYPSTHVDATWTQIIAKAKEPQYVPTVSSYTFVVNGEVDIQYSAVDMLNEISFIAASWGNFLNYSANFKDGNTNKGTLVIPSGKCMTATKNWNWEDNGFRWNKKLQDGTLMPM